MPFDSELSFDVELELDSLSLATHTDVKPTLDNKVSILPTMLHIHIHKQHTYTFIFNICNGITAFETPMGHCIAFNRTTLCTLEHIIEQRGTQPFDFCFRIKVYFFDVVQKLTLNKVYYMGET